MGIDGKGRHPHSSALDGDSLSLVGSGEAKSIANLVVLDRLPKERLGYELARRDLRAGEPRSNLPGFASMWMDIC